MVACVNAGSKVLRCNDWLNIDNSGANVSINFI